MVDLRIDLTGHLCPIPVHETRRAMDDHSPGEVIEVFSDDPESLHDIPALCQRRQAECRHELLDNGVILFRITIPDIQH
ncbi:MAG: sulfurtransferase TusA family protein [Candidatus Thalassarchaeaceae archaeon]